jgi:HNH endonuclease
MIPDLTPAEIARFYSKLVTTGCGVRWAGPVNDHGYGRFEIYRNGKRVRILAHRLMFKLTFGTDPDNEVIRHGCDTPACCTPDCFTPGTQLENVHDAIDRGRFNGGGLALAAVYRREAAQERLQSGRKVCANPECHQEKPLDEFFRHSGSLDGRQSECKTCMLKRQREYRRSKRQVA